MPSPNTLPWTGGAVVTARSISSPPGSRLVERVVIALTQQRFPDHGQDVIIVVVPNVEREIAVDPLQRARPIQRSRAAGPDTAFDGILSQMINHMPHPAPGQPGLFALTRRP